MIGDFLNSGIMIKADYFVGDTKFVLSVGFRYGKKVDIPVTLYSGDIRKLTNPTNKVLAIFKRVYPSKTYDEITYQSKNFDISKLETAIKALDDLGIETVSSYNSGDLTNGWTVTGGTATSTSTTAAVHTGSSLVAVSSFALESLSSVTITAQVNDKGSTTFSFYYSLDGGETWQLFSSGKAGVNGSSTDIALTGTAVTGPVLVKLVVTCTKAESNAKSVSITNIKIN